MKNKYLLYLLLLFIPALRVNIVYTQSVEEMKKDIANAEVMDSALAKKCYLLAQYYIATHVDSSLKYTNIGFKTAIDLKNKKLTADGFITYAGIALRSQQPEKSRNLALNALKLYEQLGNNAGIGLAFGMIASSYTSEGKFKETVKYRFYAIKYLEKSGDLLSISSAYSNLASDYRNMNDMQKALEAMKYSVKIKEKINNPISLTYGYINLGGTYQDLKNFQYSFIYYKKALVLAQQNGLDNLLPTIHLGLSSALVELQRPEEAFEYLKFNLDRYHDLKNNTLYMYTHLSRGKIYLVTNKTSLAINDYEKALEFAEAEQDPAHIRLCHDQLYQLYTGDVSNPEKALMHFKAIIEMDKQNQVSEASLLAEDLKVKYETEKKEQNITLLESENRLLETNEEKRKLWFAVLGISGLLLLLLLVFTTTLYIARNRHQKKIREIELIKTKIEFEQKVIRAQMNPHFIFNSLNSIQHYILNNETKYAYDYLARFSKLIRLVLSNSEQGAISLNKEIEFLEIYIDLEQRRFQNRFSYEISIDKEIKTDEIKIPVMLIQPFIENAIWHGIMNLEEGQNGKLFLSFSIENKLLKITIRDNGIGRKAAEKLKTGQDHESVGILFSQKRLDMLKATSGNNSQIIITDLYNEAGRVAGTRVDILLNV